MKKNSLLFATLACLALAGCSQTGTSSAATSSQQAASSAAASSLVASSSLDAEHAAAEAAANLLNYSNQAQPGLTSRRLTLTDTINDQGVKYKVDYTLTDKYTYVGSSATLIQDPDPDVLHPWALECVAAIKSTSEKNPFYLGVLSAHVKKDGIELATRDFNIRIDPVTPLEIANVPSATSGDVIVTFGYVIGKYSNNTQYLWVGDGESGVCAYGPSALPAKDTLVKISGSYGPYNGLVEFASGCTVTAATEAEITATGLSLPVKPVALTWDGTYALQNKDQSRTITATGTVSKTETSSSGNVTITFAVGTTKISVYADAAKMSATEVAPIKALTVGATKTLTGTLGYYNNKDAALAWQIINPSIVA